MEISFWGTSEGMGKALALDDFDRHYRHLVVGDRAEEKVVHGAD